VDDICCYIGSQNLYLCDLAEWGVVIDDEESVKSIKAQYWDLMWKTSYKIDDCEVDKVMDGLKISREAANQLELTKLQVEQAKQKIVASATMAAARLQGEDSDSGAEE
jgi:phosphatidylserine/phosphatidylglycerophosphate/cardiolipin synthase-like enzyme